MSHVIVLVASYVEGFFPPGTYLADMDFEAVEGRGVITTTTNLKRAKRFNDMSEALAYWKTQSKTVPLRDDGKPNRPLSSYTVEILKVST